MLSLLASTVVTEATSASGAAASFAVSATDVEDGPLAVTIDHAGGSIFPLGDTTVHVFAMDNEGAGVSGSVIVRVQDTTPPVLGGMFSPLAMLAGSLLDSYTPQVSVSDATAVSLVQSPPMGTKLSAGTVHVTITGTDTTGNHASIGFDLTVQAPIDAWRQQVFGAQVTDLAVADDLADPNANGVPNLVEFALGGDPLGSGRPYGLGAVARNWQDHAEIAFEARLGQTGVTITIQGADSAEGPWAALARSTAGGSFVALVPGVGVGEFGSGEVKLITFDDAYAIGDPGHPQRFLRLHVAR
jgi:hypothetical protein